MLGISTEPGVIPMAIEIIFDTMSKTCGKEFLLRVSYLKIYNKKVNDLLDPEKSNLKLRKDSNGLLQLINCKEEIASSPEVIMSIIKIGDKNRRIEDINEFINFRDSKLTRLLQASLGGNTTTTIICAVTTALLSVVSRAIGIN